MTSSRLLNLPCELLAIVYQMLEIADRTRLNIALPKGAAVTDVNDRKLALIHMFFKRRTRIMGASEVTLDDTSSAMRRFFQENRLDPTILRVFRESPELAKISWNTSVDPIALIMGQEPMDLRAISWADVEQDVMSVVQAVESRGTPAVFKSFMATENLVRAHVLNNSGSFVFGLVNCMNASGLLKYIMSLGDDNEYGFPIRVARSYLASPRISRIFLATPLKLKVIVDLVGIPNIFLDNLLEDAARRMLLSTVDYLMQSGATL